MPNSILKSAPQNIGAALRHHDSLGFPLCQAMTTYPTLGSLQCDENTRFIDDVLIEDDTAPLKRSPLYCYKHADDIERQLGGRLDDDDVLDPNRTRTPPSTLRYGGSDMSRSDGGIALGSPYAGTDNSVTLSQQDSQGRRRRVSWTPSPPLSDYDPSGCCPHCFRSWAEIVPSSSLNPSSANSNISTDRDDDPEDNIEKDDPNTTKKMDDKKIDSKKDGPKGNYSSNEDSKKEDSKTDGSKNRDSKKDNSKRDGSKEDDSRDKTSGKKQT